MPAYVSHCLMARDVYNVIENKNKVGKLMLKTDVVIIGAGAVGSAIARELSKYDVDVIVVLPAFNAAADTIRDRKDEVLNYFLNRTIYTSAESQNSKIKQFRAQLRGIINVDFFLYRLSMIYR